jgi:tetratricopeptide (TPR) repeat protein
LTEILYRSDKVEVRRVTGDDAKRQVVTFDSYHDDPGFDRPGFGQAYFAHYGISALHILTDDNDWFQYAEMDRVCAAVREGLAGAERVLSYGSSMGGYGAIRFADAIGAHTVLALSPQYSVDRRKARFERRWMQEQNRIRFLPAIDGPIRCRARIVVAYDPELSQDRRHVELINADLATEGLLLPYAGHPAGAFLADIGLLKPMVEQALGGTLDLAAIARDAERRREQSPSWLGDRSGQIPPGPEAIALAERSVALAPGSPPAHDRLARRLAESGRFDEAIAAHQRAIALDETPAMHGYRWNFSKTLFAAGDPAGALAIVRELQQVAPQVAGYHRWAASLGLELGDKVGALIDLETAARAAPKNKGYRWSIRLLRWRLAVDRVLRFVGFTRKD